MALPRMALPTALLKVSLKTLRLQYSSRMLNVSSPLASHMCPAAHIEARPNAYVRKSRFMNMMRKSCCSMSSLLLLRTGPPI